jgi:hypothetical protein
MTADGLKSNCPATGIHYIPKKPREPSRTTGTPSQPTSTGIPFQGRGNLIVSSMGGRRGCIISRGKWFASGTCATFKAKKVTGTLLQKGRAENYRHSNCACIGENGLLTRYQMTHSPCNLARESAHSRETLLAVALTSLLQRSFP